MTQIYTLSIDRSSKTSDVDQAFFDFIITQKKADLQVRCSPYLIQKLSESTHTTACHLVLSEPGCLRWKYATCSVRCVIDFDLTGFQCIEEKILS